MALVDDVATALIGAGLPGEIAPTVLGVLDGLNKSIVEAEAEDPVPIEVADALACVLVKVTGMPGVYVRGIQLEASAGWLVAVESIDPVSKATVRSGWSHVGEAGALPT